MRLTIALLLLVACKPKVGFEKAEVEKTGAQLFEQITGLKPDKFSCPGDDERLMGDMVCTATVSGTTVDVDTSITTGKGGIFGKGDMQINIKNYVFGKNIADEIIKQSKGKPIEVTKVDCPPVTKLEAGKTFKCTATANNMEVPIEITMNETGWNSRIIPDAPAPSDLPMVPDPTTLGPQ